MCDLKNNILSTNEPSVKGLPCLIKLPIKKNAMDKVYFKINEIINQFYCL